MMRIGRTSVGILQAGLAASLIAAAPLPSVADGGRDPQSPGVVELLAWSDSHASLLRSSAESGEAFQVLATALRSGGQTVPERPSIDPPMTPAAAIHRLATAVRGAIALAEPMSAAEVAHRLERSGGGTTLTRMPAPTHSILGDRESATTWSPTVDRPELPLEGAALIAAALDASLPLLADVAAARPVAARVVDGCNLVDQLPLLCVGSEASNRYTENAALLIDLGGNDTYLNTAGGAPFQSTDPAATIPVSVNVDLAGDDVYSPTPNAAGLGPSTSVAAGAALPQAIGIAVDVAGNDTYTSTIAAPPTEGTAFAGGQSFTVVQGAAHQGVGMLIDPAGNDRYAVVRDPSDPQSPPGVRELRHIMAQGGGLVGVGVLVDGGGQDRYDVDGGLVDHLTDDGTTVGVNGGHSIVAQGASWTGLGALVDIGSEANAFAVRSETRPAPNNESLTVGSAPKAIHVAQGGANYGPSFLLTGTGDTTYTSETVHHGMGGRDWMFVQGGGTATGRGTLDDLGGDDTYSVSISARSERRLELGCPKPCATNTQPLIAAFTDTIVVAAQGAALEAAAGALHDHGGDDEYLVHTDHVLDVELVDHRQSEPRASLSVGGYAINVQAQGAGAFFTQQGGTGVLTDVLGTDRYEIETASRTAATGTTTQAGQAPLAMAIALNPVIWAQGSTTSIGEAALIDQGGPGDVFSVRADPDIRAMPNEKLAFLDSSYWPQVQGAGQGAFRAGGQSVEIRSSPPLPACVLDDTSTVAAVRGVGEWQNCPSDNTLDPDTPTPDREHIGTVAYPAIANMPYGYGRAPLASTSRTMPRLAMDPAQGDQPLTRGQAVDPERSAIPVRATVADSAGAPLVDVPVDFVLQFRCAASACYVTSWRNVWRSSAVTDQNGLVSAWLQAYAIEELGQAYPASEFRILAMTGGSAEHVPAYASVPLTLRDG